eukprot:s392_g11.t2
MMTPKGAGTLQRKASVASRSEGATPDAERSERSYDGYYPEEGWWEEEGYGHHLHHFNGYETSYYEEWPGEAGRQDDIEVEVDLYSMVFVLDECLTPKPAQTLSKSRHAGLWLLLAVSATASDEVKRSLRGAAETQDFHMLTQSSQTSAELSVTTSKEADEKEPGSSTRAARAMRAMMQGAVAQEAESWLSRLGGTGTAMVVLSVSLLPACLLSAYKRMQENDSLGGFLASLPFDNPGWKDLYNGIELDDSSFVFSLEADDVAPQTPAAWRARPLKIHPEPPPINQRKDPGSGTPTRSGAATVDASTGNNTPTGGRTPRQKASTPPKLETPPPKDLPPLAGAGERPGLAPLAVSASRVEPSTMEDSEPSDEALMDPGKTSAKIHISNRQLEHLKQKMQVLKQRKSTPAEEREKEKEKDPKHKEEGAKEAKEASKEAEKSEKGDEDAEIPNVSKRMEGKVHSNCPGAHGLSFFLTPENGWWCSVCEKEHVKGSGFYGCRQCDYDECQRCALTPQPASKAAAPQPEPGNNSHAETTSRGNNAMKTPPPPPPPPQKGPPGAAKTPPAPPDPKKGSSNAASSSSSSSTSGQESGRSKSKSKSSTRSRSSPVRRKGKDAKKDKEKKKEEKKDGKKKDPKKSQAKRKATAKVKVKKSMKRPQKPTKSASRSRSSENSESKSNGEKEKKKKKKNKKSDGKRAADPKLVPRKEPERWEPKRRKDEKEVSPPPKRKAERSRSRDTSPSAAQSEAQSEAPAGPPKKRAVSGAANALSVPTETRAPAVSLTRAVRRDDEKRSPEARRWQSQEARNRPQARDGQELLRRVLRAQLCPGKRAQSTRATKEGEPRATLVPPSRKAEQDASSDEASPPRATLRPPQDRAKKALEARKPRRV